MLSNYYTKESVIDVPKRLLNRAHASSLGRGCQRHESRQYHAGGFALHFNLQLASRTRVAFFFKFELAPMCQDLPTRKSSASDAYIVEALNTQPAHLHHEIKRWLVFPCSPPRVSLLGKSAPNFRGKMHTLALTLGAGRTRRRRGHALARNPPRGAAGLRPGAVQW